MHGVPFCPSTSWFKNFILNPYAKTIGFIIGFINVFHIREKRKRENLNFKLN